MLHTQRRRDGENGTLVRKYVFRVTATWNESDHGVAGFQSTVSSAIPKLLNPARDLQPECFWRAGRRRIFACALDQIRPVHASCGHADEHLVRAWLRTGDLVDSEGLTQHAGNGAHVRFGH